MTEPIHQCQHESCANPGLPCFDPNENLDGWEVEPSSFYCHEHSHIHGYCDFCGRFWGGIESFDMNPSGLCDYCQDDDDDFYLQGDCEDEDVI